MSKLSVTFGDPEFGWIDVSLQFGNERFTMEASDIYNPFFPLVDALLQLCTSAELMRPLRWRFWCGRILGGTVFVRKKFSRLTATMTRFACPFGEHCADYKGVSLRRI